VHLPPVAKVLGSRLTLGHLSRLTLEQTDIEKIAVDWDRLEEGEDFQLVSPTAFFFSFQPIFKSSSIASSIHLASRSMEATSVERC
jgi:hypothetical protein